MPTFSYDGTELQLFALAKNWKRYYRAVISRFLKGDVLEVGAGIGTNTALFADCARRRWVCLEPDPLLASRIPEGVREVADVVVGTIEDLEPSDLYDAILYIDVLEHIENDRAELSRAAVHLRPGGVIVVLAPAHQSLYTPFDASIGHWRRYNKAALAAIGCPELRIVEMKYLDAAGLLASLGNRFVLHSPMPTETQIILWDRWLIPVSTLVDRLLRHSLGKSIVCVWQRS